LQEKIKTNDDIIEVLKGEVKQLEFMVGNQREDNDNIEEKIKDQEAKVTARDNELTVLRRKIEDNANKAEVIRK
jgi:hypothetical protein